MSKKDKKVVRRTRNGKVVVPVIAYMPEPLHRSVKAMAKRQGVTQDALINRWATNAVNGSKGAAKQKKERAIEKEMRTMAASVVPHHAEA